MSDEEKSNYEGIKSLEERILKSQEENEESSTLSFVVISGVALLVIIQCIYVIICVIRRCFKTTLREAVVEAIP